MKSLIKKSALALVSAVILGGIAPAFATDYTSPPTVSWGCLPDDTGGGTCLACSAAAPAQCATTPPVDCVYNPGTNCTCTCKLSGTGN